MWLLHTRSLKLEWFTDCSCVPYAILSHRWEDHEVTFTTMQSGEVVKEEKGYQKVLKACRRAVLDRWDYIWIDTCCINKDSSAELSESINSMFRWYRSAGVCYAYLFDVGPLAPEFDCTKPVDRILHSEWFTRGWTLQELIAPRQVVFFDNKFMPVCERHEASNALSLVTNINAHVLEGLDFRSLSIAERMSWASKRRTTRIEDQAYSLMGLFGVNMPLLYGEGRRAFRRLQEEIIRSSDDHSVLAWQPKRLASQSEGSMLNPNAHCGTGDTTILLAESPEVFEHGGNITTSKLSSVGTSEPSLFTNIGLRITLKVVEANEHNFFAYALLDCHLKDEPLSQLAIPVSRKGLDGNEYYRMDSLTRQFTLSERRHLKCQSVLLRRCGRPPGGRRMRCWLRSMPAESQGVRLVDHFPHSAWNSKARFWDFTPDPTRPSQMLATWLRFETRDQRDLLLCFHYKTLCSGKGGIYAFTLVNSRGVSLAEMAESLSGHALQGHPTSHTLSRMWRRHAILVDGYTGVQVQFDRHRPLGEDTCVVDVSLRDAPLACHFGRVKRLLRSLYGKPPSVGVSPVLLLLGR